VLATVACANAHAKKAAHKPSKTSTAKVKPAPAVPAPIPFSQWGEVEIFADQMVIKHGFNKSELLQTLDQAKYLESSVQLVKPAPADRPKNWKAYRARFVEPKRIDAGVAFWRQYDEPLKRAESQYGVPPEIIVGLIGVETVFGRNMGNVRTMDALTTLAFAYPDTPNRDARMAFFRKELTQLLLITREAQIDPFLYKGSYAGAIGWPQFMPSSIRDYAVDFDGDGHIDLMNSPTDAIGSVANYLARHGWKRYLPSAFPATITNEGNTAEQLGNALAKGLKASFTLEELKPIATTASQDALEGYVYGLIDLQNGTEATEYWLVTDNFYAITHYNRSYFYAMSVIDLGGVIALANLP
jgi:membrane-bound lytic murein transglycosylase B